MHNSRQNTLAWDRNQADLKPNTGYRHGRNDQNSLIEQRPDIAERGLDPNVYDFAYDNINPLTWPRNEVSYMPTGYKNEYPKSLHQHKHHHRHNDNRAERDMDEEVHEFGNFAQSQDIAERGMESSWVHPYVA